MNDPMHALANAITEKFILASPQEAAKALESLATHEILLLVAPLKAQVLVTCFNGMHASKAAAVLRRLPLKQASHIFMHLDIIQAAQLADEFSAPYRERLFSVLPESFIHMLNQAKSYPADSAGALMKTDFLAVKTDTKISQLVERLKTWPRTKLPPVCFVTAKDGSLKGAIRSSELAFYDGNALCGSVMVPCQSVSPVTGGNVLKKHLETAAMDLVPVTNEKQILVGVVSRWNLLNKEETSSFWKKWTR